MAENILKQRRMFARCSLVQVAAEAACSIHLVQKYELAPSAVADLHKRARLDAIYQRFAPVAA